MDCKDTLLWALEDFGRQWSFCVCLFVQSTLIWVEFEGILQMWLKSLIGWFEVTRGRLLWVSLTSGHLCRSGCSHALTLLLCLSLPESVGDGLQRTSPGPACLWPSVFRCLSCRFWTLLSQFPQMLWALSSCRSVNVVYISPGSVSSQWNPDWDHWLLRN